MSKTGAVYERISGDDRCQVEAATGGGEINSSAMDGEFNDFADAMNEVFWRDGSAAMTGNLDLNSYQLQNTGTITGNVTFTDSVDVQGNLTSSGGVTFSNGLSVMIGDVLINDTLTGNDVILTGDLDVSGTITGNVTGDVTGNVTGDLSTTSLTFTGGSPEVLGVPTFINGLVSDDDVTVNGGLYATGLASLASGGSMAGSFSGSPTFSGNVTFSNILTMTGTFKLDSDAPSSATDAGAEGTLTYDADYLYFCAEDDKWGRIPKQWIDTSLAFTKQTISGTGTQSVDLDDGWLIDTTISGSQELDFSNGAAGVNGTIKLINTNGNTFDLTGTGLTFKRSNNGVLEAYSQITLESGASTEQIITFHFQSDTEVIYTVS